MYDAVAAGCDEKAWYHHGQEAAAGVREGMAAACFHDQEFDAVVGHDDLHGLVNDAAAADAAAVHDEKAGYHHGQENGVYHS